MLRLLAVAIFFAAVGCADPKLLIGSSKSQAIPGPAIDAYAKQKGVSPEEARQAMIADHLSSKGASLPKQAVQPLQRSSATCESCGD
jgi:hypothetical protein